MDDSEFTKVLQGRNLALKSAVSLSPAPDRAAVVFARERAIITRSLSAVSACSYQKRKSFSSQSPRGL